ncbi:hypothetical protein Bca52824_019518 [Brassica carinata]|uniref:Mediator complex subunit 15 KIX domain-containing protein n=1 Tax=Brassica carinata TaxID=52824 RepID=A0A8X7VRP7_BRACI|nr:hypothetical protein Bca52824_019518 [Brassica carinata]
MEEYDDIDSMEGSCNEQGGDSLANDWRTQHEPHLRRKVIFAIVQKLKKSFHQHSENDIKNLTFRFEDKIYGMATDKDDYLRRLSRKVRALNQGQSLSTSLPCTQTPPQNNIQSNLNSPESSSGLPTQVPITTVSAAQNENIQMSEGVHSNLLPGPQREIQQLLPQSQQQQLSSNTMFQHQMDQQLQYIHADCTGKTLNTSDGDWREETYQKIKALKEKYVLVLSTLLQSFSDKLREIDSLSQQNMPHDEPVEWVKRGQETLEQVLVFLNVCKSSVSEFHRDRFSLYERKVLKFNEYHQTMTQRSKQRQQQVYQQPQTNQQQQLQIPENEWKDVRIRQRVNSKAEFEFQQHLSSSQHHLPKPLASPARVSNLSPSASSPQMQNFPSPHQLVEQQTLPAPLNKTAAQEHPLVTLPSEPVSERPIDRLIKAIQSSSPESLAQSVSEMRSVISMTDRFAGSVHPIGGSRDGLDEDLSERTRLRLQQGDTNPTKRFKRSLTAIPLDSTASSSSKLNKIEPSYALLQEIMETNRRLVETVVSICNEDVCPSEVTLGLTVVVVTCSYVPVALSATFKALYNSEHISQIQPLRLLVPENYPCSPIVLDKTLFDGASVHKLEDLSARARSRFGLSVGEHSETMSLKGIAQVWDECARATMLEYAEGHGGGTFSSKYGRWEMERLKICFHQLSENDIKNTAIKFEDKIYGIATDKDDYLWKISRKVLGIHRKFIIVSSDNGANTTPDPDDLAYQALNQGQSLPTSLPYTQTPTNQQCLPQINIQSNLNSPESSSGLPTQVPITTVSAAHNQMSEEGVHSNLLPGPQREIQQLSSKTMFRHQMDQQLQYIHADYTEKTSFTPSPKPISVESPLSNANQIQTESQEHPLFTLPPEPLLERPIDRLIKAVQSSSPESLAQSVREMSRVISLTDRFSGSVHTIRGSRARLGEDLSERTRFRLQQGDTHPTKRFKRSLTAIPLDSTEVSGSEVNKIEPSYALLQEIIEINGRLVETVVSICNEDVCCPIEVTSGTTVVACSYVPVALSATFKALYNSGHITQIQPLRLLVPENYPSSPIILEEVFFDTTASVHKYEDLSARARWRFGLSMKEYSEAMTLKEIAKVWDECARATMAEYAERHGGGTFSSRYGRWESVLRAS